MSKPLGMTPFMEVIRPTREQDHIWDAVEAAIDAGWTVEQFRQEAAECWDNYMRQKLVSDQKAWRMR